MRTCLSDLSAGIFWGGEEPDCNGVRALSCLVSVSLLVPRPHFASEGSRNELMRDLRHDLTPCNGDELSLANPKSDLLIASGTSGINITVD